MNKIFEQMEEEKITMNSNLEVDVTRIKSITMSKINKKNRFDFKKILVIAASFLLLLSFAGATAYAFAGPVLRSYIQETLGLEIGEVLLVGESVSNKDYQMTVEDFIYDGVIGEVTISVTALSNKAKESFKSDSTLDKFGHISLSGGTSELEEYAQDNKRYFSKSFSNTLEKYDHIIQSDTLIFAFEGIRDMINIPLNPTLSSEQKDIFIEAHNYYPNQYQSIVYSKIGFTLIGELMNEEENPSNETIDFELKTGEIIKFVNKIDYDYKRLDEKTKTSSENQESIKETILIDGIKTRVDRIRTEIIEENAESDNIDETNNEWLSSIGGSGYSTSGETKFKTETSYGFRKSFDWENVASMTINGTKIDF